MQFIGHGVQAPLTATAPRLWMSGTVDRLDPPDADDEAVAYRAATTSL